MLLESAARDNSILIIILFEIFYGYMLYQPEIQLQEIIKADQMKDKSLCKYFMRLSEQKAFCKKSFILKINPNYTQILPSVECHHIEEGRGIEKK